jgi:hypothetical protein
MRSALSICDSYKHLVIYEFFLASSYIFHDIGNIVKHSLIINKWMVEI